MALRVGVDIGGTFDPARVAAGVRDETITAGFARREHGVAIDPATFEMDEDATRRLRAARGGGQP
jgi:hypothetical protein